MGENSILSFTSTFVFNPSTFEPTSETHISNLLFKIKSLRNSITTKLIGEQHNPFINATSLHI